MLGSTLCYYHFKMAQGITEPHIVDEELGIRYSYSIRDSQILASLHGVEPTMPTFKSTRNPIEPKAIWVSELSRLDVPRQCRGCEHIPLETTDALLDRNQLCNSCRWQRDAALTGDGMRQCCKTCKYLRWGKDDREWAENGGGRFTLNPTEVEACLQGKVSWDDMFFPYGWHMHTEFDYDEQDRLIPGSGRNVLKWERRYRFPQQEGEVPVPICDLGERDFDEEWGLITYEQYGDSYMKRWEQEEFERITDPAQVAWYIQRAPNAPVLRLESSPHFDEHGELQEGDDIPELGDPLPSEVAYANDANPMQPPHMGQGKRDRNLQNRITISRRRKLNQMLWESGCPAGVHTKTGRNFTLWEAKAKQVPVVKNDNWWAEHIAALVVKSIDASLQRMAIANAEARLDQAIANLKLGATKLAEERSPEDDPRPTQLTPELFSEFCASIQEIALHKLEGGKRIA
jgi:hypothetical protein